jgi:hypothetical protein
VLHEVAAAEAVLPAVPVVLPPEPVAVLQAEAGFLSAVREGAGAISKSWSPLFLRHTCLRTPRCPTPR